MKLPTELQFHAPDDTPFLVRFDFSRGESQWFDRRAGVGSPGHDPYAEVTEVNFGKGWESPEAYPQINYDALENEILERLAEIDAERCEY